MHFIISESPAINISIQMELGLIVKVTLSPDSQFTCTMNEKQDEVVRWLEDYSKKRSATLNSALFKWDHLTSIMQNFLPALGSVSFGQPTTYKDLGQVIRCHPRGIGQLCNKNPYPLFYPCHRVLAANGLIGGFNYGVDTKATLLEFEEIDFLKNE